MGIILSIRKFFNLDEETVEVNPHLLDATGLLLLAKKDLMTFDDHGCFGGRKPIDWYEISLPWDSHQTQDAP